MAGQKKNEAVTLKLTQVKLNKELHGYDEAYKVGGKSLTLRRVLFNCLEVAIPDQKKEKDAEEMYKAHRLTDKVMSESGTVELTVDEIKMVKDRLFDYCKNLPQIGTRVYGLTRDIIDPPK